MTRYIDPRFGVQLRQLREQHGLTYRGLAALSNYSRAYLNELEAGDKPPTEAIARRLDDVLKTGGTLTAMVRTARGPVSPNRLVAIAADPTETTELLRRIAASDTTNATLEPLHATAHELCCQYSWRDAHELRAEGHAWLREVIRLLHQPVGLRAHRELLTIAGWLALLVGCVEYDLGMRAAAEATRVAARQLGEEAGNGEIAAWAWEMSAWFALTQGRYRNVVTAAEAGQAAIGEHTAAVQLLAQEAKALGRMGDINRVRTTLDRGRKLLDMFPRPERPDNHFVVDPDKWDFYAMDAYRLAGDDELADHHARQVIALGTTPDGSERVPMRMAEARLTLGAVAARGGELEQAVETGLSALRADRRSLPSLLMVAAELDAELHHRYPQEQATEEFRDALRVIAEL